MAEDLVLEAAKARIEALMLENAQLKADLATFRKDTETTENRIIDAEFAVTEAKHEIKRLRAALKPFIIAANDAEGYPDNHPIGCDPCMQLGSLSVGNLRRARTAL